MNIYRDPSDHESQNDTDSDHLKGMHPSSPRILNFIGNTFWFHVQWLWERSVTEILLTKFHVWFSSKLKENEIVSENKKKNETSKLTSLRVLKISTSWMFFLFIQSQLLHFLFARTSGCHVSWWLLSRKPTTVAVLYLPFVYHLESVPTCIAHTVRCTLGLIQVGKQVTWNNVFVSYVIARVLHVYNQRS